MCKDDMRVPTRDEVNAAVSTFGSDSFSVYDICRTIGKEFDLERHNPNHENIRKRVYHILGSEVKWGNLVVVQSGTHETHHGVKRCVKMWRVKGAEA